MFCKKILVILIWAHLLCGVGAVAVVEQGPLDMPTLLKKADAGDAQAQLELGILYYTGQGVRQDTYLAMYFIKMSATQCNLDAFFTLKAIYIKEYWQDKDGRPFCMLSTGQGFADGSRLKLLADQGDSYAQLFLAMLANGCSTSIGYIDFASVSWRAHSFNQEIERKLLESAAAANNVYAMFYLGAFHRAKSSFERDEREAFNWYEKAAKLGHPYAQYWTGIAYINGTFANHLGPFVFGKTNLSLDDKKAFYWIEKAAVSSIPDALYILAWMYGEGRGVKKDLDRAMQLLNECESKLKESGEVFGEPSNLVNSYKAVLAFRARSS